MVFPVENVFCRTDLNDFARIHHRHVIAGLRHNAQVMRDHDHRRTQPVPQLSYHKQDLSLDRHIQRRRRLICNKQIRLTGQRHRDHHPLLHSSGELMRILMFPGRRNPYHI